jgi:hypothetical protein
MHWYWWHFVAKYVERKLAGSSIFGGEFVKDEVWFQLGFTRKTNTCHWCIVFHSC